MKWVAREISREKWGVFLMPQFCKTEEAVCYGVATGKNAKKNAERSAERFNKNHESSSAPEDKS